MLPRFASGIYVVCLVLFAALISPDAGSNPPLEPRSATTTMNVDASLKSDIKECVEVLRKNLTCSICFSVCTEAVSLPCNHFYCLHCLDSMQLHNKSDKSDKADKDSFPCPHCRTSYHRRNRVIDPTVRNLTALYRRLHELTSDDLDLDMLSQGAFCFRN